jgi:hypothetical protein
MAGFLTSLLDEMGQRQRRLRAAIGDRGHALLQFLVLAGLALGSIGLYVRPWMAAATPWGLWLPPVFLVGYLLIDWRRQGDAARSDNANAIASRYDWLALAWSFACAFAGAAAFVIAMSSEPPPPQIEEWSPPESAVSVEISP